MFVSSLHINALFRRYLAVIEPRLNHFRTSFRKSSSSSSPFVLKSKYGDFKTVEASRRTFNKSDPITVSQTPDPSWKYGKGSPGFSGKHIAIDPFAEDRQMVSNYKLLVSGIARPVSFVSTISAEGIENLAPFSYFQVVDHDPPTFVIGFSARAGRVKDTRRNLVETGECVINVLSEHMVEASNATSLDVPFEESEWLLSGCTKAESSTVKPQRVNEAVFSIEGKLLEMKSLDYHGKEKLGKPTGALAIIEATRFWVRQDALNEARDEIDLGKMRPLVQLGGISYGRVREIFELPRPSLVDELQKGELGLKKFLRNTTGIR